MIPGQRTGDQRGRRQKRRREGGVVLVIADVPMRDIMRSARGRGRAVARGQDVETVISHVPRVRACSASVSYSPASRWVGEAPVIDRASGT